VRAAGIASPRVGESAKWQMVAAAAAVALAVFGAVRLLDRESAGGGADRVRVSREDSAGGVASDERRGGPVLYVHVAGAVSRPGVYRLRGGSRVTAAVARAGGAARRADLDAVNLAAPLEDGQQVIVPSRVAGPAGGAAAGAADAPVSLATASAEELEELDGIGETIAERIVEYRADHGGLASVDELGEVDGIGEKRLEALKDALRP
jgi:competence protein ComEA